MLVANDGHPDAADNAAATRNADRRTAMATGAGRETQTQFPQPKG